MAASVSEPEALAALFRRSERAVVLTGRRIGAPEGGDLGRQSDEWASRASLDAFLTEPRAFWEYFYPAATEVAGRRPSPGHHALARLQRAGVISVLITQSVDRLHTKAGSAGVVEVHGQLLTERCERCGERYGLPEVGELIARQPDGVPRCTTPGCDYPVRPEGTLWGESLPRAAVERAWQLAAWADLFVVIDSELRTAPISLLPSVPLTRGVPLAVVSQVPTQYDRYAEVVVRSPSEPVLIALADLLAPSDPPP